MMALLVPYLILAASLAANLFLFFSLKKEIHAHAARHSELAARLRGIEENRESPPDSGPAPPRPGFNLNTRVQALRLSRQGESPDHIAARLGVPRREVELLIRVRRMAGGLTNSNPG